MHGFHNDWGSDSDETEIKELKRKNFELEQRIKELEGYYDSDCNLSHSREEQIDNIRREERKNFEESLDEDSEGMH
jgi:thymidylate synthase